MCYPVCGMVHIKEPLLVIGRSSPCGGNRFPLQLSEWFFTIDPMPYNCKLNVLSVSLNRNISFLPNKGCDVLSCLCDDAYKRSLAANRKVKAVWQQQVSCLTI